jgi:hypothetical protein
VAESRKQTILGHQEAIASFVRMKDREPNLADIAVPRK